MRVRFKTDYRYSPDGLHSVDAKEGDVAEVLDDLGKALIKAEAVEEDKGAELKDERDHAPGFGSFPKREGGELAAGSTVKDGWGARDADANSSDVERAMLGAVLNAARTLVTEPMFEDQGSDRVSGRFKAAFATLAAEVGVLHKSQPLVQAQVATDPGALTRGHEADYRQPARYDPGSFQGPGIPPRAIGPNTEVGGEQTATRAATDPGAIAQTAHQLKTEEPGRTGARTMAEPAAPKPAEQDEDGLEKNDPNAEAERKRREAAVAKRVPRQSADVVDDEDAVAKREAAEKAKADETAKARAAAEAKAKGAAPFNKSR